MHQRPIGAQITGLAHDLQVLSVACSLHFRSREEGMHSSSTSKLLNSKPVAAAVIGAHFPEILDLVPQKSGFS